MRFVYSNMDALESFVVKYENTDGKGDTFNLLKGKKEIAVDIDIMDLNVGAGMKL